MRAWILAAILAVVLQAASPRSAAAAAGGSGDTPSAEDAGGATAVCGGLWLSGGELHDATTGVLVWSEATGTVTAIACRDDVDTRMAAIGMARGERGDGKIVLLAPGADEGGPWSVVGEIPTRGVPRRLAIESGRLAMALEGRREKSFGIADAKPGAKVQMVTLGQMPVALGVSPDGGSFVVAAGNDLRTFRVDDGRTRMIIPFPEPIVSLAAQRGIARILVGQGSGVVAVDPRDKPELGRLPVRAHADLPGPAASLIWLNEGRAAAARIESPPGVLVLGGNDLAVLDRREVESDAIGAAGASEVRWVRGGDAKTTGVVRSAVEPPALAPYEPAPEPLPPATAEVPIPEPPPAKVEAPPSPPVKVEPPPPPPVKVEPPQLPPVKVEPPPPEKVEPPPPPPVKAEPSPPTNVEPPPPTKVEPPAKAEPPPVKVEPPPPVRAEPPPPAKIEPPPGKIVTSPLPVVPPVTTESAPAPTAPAPSPPVALPPVPPAVAPSAGGTIAGTITGRLELIEEVVVLGPDSLLKQFARVKVTRSGGSAAFRVEVPPGRYVVTPMGAHGASLSARPAATRVVVTGDAGARVDFEIIGAL